MSNENTSLKDTSSLLSKQDRETFSILNEENKRNTAINILVTKYNNIFFTGIGFKAFDSLGHAFIDFTKKDSHPSVVYENMICLLSINTTKELHNYFAKNQIKFYVDSDPYELLKTVSLSDDGAFYVEVMEKLFISGKTVEQIYSNDYSFSEVANVWPQFFKINNFYYFIK